MNIPIINFYKNPSSGSHVNTVYVDGWTDAWPDVTKAIDDFCEYANAPKTANIYVDVSLTVHHELTI